MEQDFLLEILNDINFFSKNLFRTIEEINVRRPKGRAKYCFSNICFITQKTSEKINTV